MFEQNFGGVKVDLCDNCKGIWFDWMELVKLDESNEGFGNALKDALADSRTNDESRGKLNCPKCGLPMHIHKYVSAKEINVDECYKCGGFFLDSGELRYIRDNFMSNDERIAYTKKIVDGIPEYARQLEDLEKNKLRNQAISNYTKFLRLSYYV
ncbi:MAG: hypothetical protein DRP78_03900, partial [Candidatus Omnitrophota bacterium]